MVVRQKFLLLAYIPEAIPHEIVDPSEPSGEGGEGETKWPEIRLPVR